MNGPWADWDDTLEGQKVYFAVAHYPLSTKATEELRDLLIEEDIDLTPGRPKKDTISLCMKDCEESCEHPSHQQQVRVWVYTPRRKRERVSKPPRIMRCPACRLLCVSSGRTGKTYMHGAYSPSAGRLIHCSGSKQPALSPVGTRHP